MKPCKYRHSVEEEDSTCGCHNTQDLLHGGRVSFNTCRMCPYAEAPLVTGLGDLVELGLNAVGITEDRVKKVTGKDDCGCKKRKAALNKLVPFGVPEEPQEDCTPDELQFIWVYWDGGAGLDELRYSMRSVEKNYQGKAKLTIIGDRPIWFKGHVIRQSRVNVGDRGFQRGLRDVLAKMDTLSRHPDVQDEFVWMMDDVFMVQPCTYADLVIPRAGGRIRSSKHNRWQAIKTNTAARLERNGHTTYDYGTHLPHHVEKAKLAEMFKVWKPLDHLFLWEVVYGNLYRGKPQSHVPFLRRTKDQHSNVTYNRWARQNSFFNLAQNGWGNQIRNWLIDRFPERAAGEVGALPVHMSSKARNEPIDEHIILIQSAYDDEVVSRDRLDLSRKTVFPSLQQQTRPAKLQVSVCEDDPLLADRKSMFESTGHAVEYVYNSPATLDTLRDHKWNLPVGPRNLVGRVDDDDILPTDFCRISQEKAPYCDVNGLLVWPNGYVFYEGEFYRKNHPGNQFCALVSREGLGPHEHAHRSYVKAWPVLYANVSRGWVWVRHDGALTGTMARYRRNKGTKLNTRRFPYDFEAL